jgi:plastocyanin
MSGMHAGPRRDRLPAAVTGVLFCALAIAVALLAGCGSSGSSAGATSGASAPAGGPGTQTSSGAEITIKDFAFTVPPSVSPGAKVRVTNMDGLAHTVTADDGRAFDAPAPAGNSTFTAPTAPGSYPFHFSIHPEMHGVLVVR